MKVDPPLASDPAPTPFTITLREHERETTDRLTPAQAGVLRHKYGTYLNVERAFDGAGWDITAGPYAGIITLPGLHIYIRPKVPLDNLFFMLAYAYDLGQFRDDATNLAPEADLLDVIVRAFADQVEGVTRGGLYRSYQTRDGADRYLRGRLRLATHLRRNAGYSARFWQRASTFTADLLENQILAYTVWQLTRLDWRDDLLRRRLRRLGRAFADVTLRPVQPLECLDVHFTRLNNHYTQAIHLARLLLAHLSLAGKQGDHPFAAFLIDMNRLFERFIAYFLKAHLAADSGLAVRLQPTIWLDEEGRERGVPDIVLTRDNRPVQVLDTKYKAFSGRPERADLNQMYVYGQTMALPAGTLIYPDPQADGYAVQMKGMRLQTRGVDLSGPRPQFHARCQALATWLAAAARDAA